MMRFGLLLMIVLLAAPMVRDCCLPPAQAPPCHGATQGEDQACISNEQAIIQVNSNGVVSFTTVFTLMMVHTDELYPSAGLSGQLALPHLFIADVNLRTGALLI